jgi:hypothetical protein
MLALVLGLQVVLSDWFIGGKPTMGEFDASDARGRIANAEHSLNQMASLNFGTRTVFLSFNDTITFTTMQNALDSVSDTGNIVVEAVYTLGEDNAVDVFSGADLATMQALRGSNYSGESSNIVGAKVYTPVTLISDLSKQSEVALVEISTEELNENNFVPLAAVGGIREPAEVTSLGEQPTETVSVETFLNFNIAGVTHAEFIDDYRFTAITADTVALYEICRDRDEGDESLQIILVSEHVLDGELLFTFFDEENCRKILRVRNDDGNTIYVLDGNSELAEIASISDEGRLSVLALTSDTLYYSVERMVVYAYEIATGISTELIAFEIPVSFERNTGLTGFIVNPADSRQLGRTQAQVFDAFEKTLAVSAECVQSLMFYRNSTNILTDGTRFFDMALEVVEEVRDSEINLAERRNMSELFGVFEITELGIRILVN